MGYDDRDDSYRSRSQAPRRRSYDDENNSSAAYSSRDPRDMSGPRSRPPRRDYDDDDYGRRGPRSAPGGANGSSGRYPRDDYDRSSGSAGGPRSGPGYGANANRPNRSGWSDPGASSPRSGRPPSRDDGFGESRGPRSGANGNGGNGYGGRPSPSDGRMRRVAPGAGGPGGGRGGLWGDGTGGSNAQAIRARMAAQQADDDDEEGSFAAGVAKAFGAIILALIIGIGGAYGYYVMSAPKLHATPYQQPAPTVAPKASPSATKTGLITPPSDRPTLLIG